MDIHNFMGETKMTSKIASSRDFLLHAMEAAAGNHKRARGLMGYFRESAVSVSVHEVRDDLPLLSKTKFLALRENVTKPFSSTGEKEKIVAPNFNNENEERQFNLVAAAEDYDEYLEYWQQERGDTQLFTHDLPEDWNENKIAVCPIQEDWLPEFNLSTRISLYMMHLNMFPEPGNEAARLFHYADVPVRRFWRGLDALRSTMMAKRLPHPRFQQTSPEAYVAARELASTLLNIGMGGSFFHLIEHMELPRLAEDQPWKMRERVIETQELIFGETLENFGAPESPYEAWVRQDYINWEIKNHHLSKFQRIAAAVIDSGATE